MSTTDLKLPFNKDLILKLYTNKLNNLLIQLENLEKITIDKLMEETKFRLIFNKKFPQIEKYHPFNRESAVKKFLSADYNDNDPKHKRWIIHRNRLTFYIEECKSTINWINKSTIENIPLTESQFNDLERWTTNS